MNFTRVATKSSNLICASLHHYVHDVTTFLHLNRFYFSWHSPNPPITIGIFPFNRNMFWVGITLRQIKIFFTHSCIKDLTPGGELLRQLPNTYKCAFQLASADANKCHSQCIIWCCQEINQIICNYYYDLCYSVKCLHKIH